ncbi:MAG TPA: FkbM family methyltransferase [Steroidobacteraceae bacterium]|nr:FkbM family methyltransferase [Steroidobacteraceae bacterium]
MQIEVSDQARNVASLLNNVGLAAAGDGGDGLEAGVAMIRRSIALNPLDLNLRMNLASLLMQRDADDEVEEICLFTLKHNENAAGAWSVLGVIHTHRGQIDDATACFKKAWDIEPTGQHTFDLAAAYLRAGDFERGLPLYEHRHLILPKTGPTPNAPVWKGEKVDHLAVYSDQGYGDVMLFSRFLPWAKEQCGKVTLYTDPATVPLLYNFRSIIDVESVYSTETKFGAQIALASIPLVYGLRMHNIPPDSGLLSPSATDGRLVSPGLKIGIAWQGNRRFPADVVRSIPFKEFLPLAADPRNTIYSLQCGHDAGIIAKLRTGRIIRDMTPDIEGEWSHTAAVIKNLDLVVCSCTGIAHLAGALGVPCFVMVPRFGYWLWFHGRDDTPWYPHTQLFRQTKVGQWSDVMTRVLAAIEMMHKRRSLVAMLNRGYGASSPVVQQYEPEVAAVLRKVLRKGDCFIDVGAAAGIHTVAASDLVGDEGRVIACEPGEQNLPKLRQNIGDRKNVEIVEAPLSNAADDVTLYINSDNENNSLWDPGEFPGPANIKSRENPRPVTMRATTLDAIAGNRVVPTRLIKIDTEGAEQTILEGAADLLSRSDRPPYIVAELHEFGLNKLGHSQKSLRTFMSGHGYSTYILKPDGSRPVLVDEKQGITFDRDGCVLNMLFSTREAIDEAWGVEADEVDQWAGVAA